MSFELAPGTLLNNRYQIKKVIAFAEDGGVYQARDLKVTDRNWIVKEMIPASALDEATLAERKALYMEAVESIMQFDHPGLSRIFDQFSEAKREYVIMEPVDGVTLQTLCDMSVNPLPERQILGWGLQICEALSYLHNRPKPFIFHALKPAHVILTSDEKVKLINYGLDRFFAVAEPPRFFTDSPADILKEFARFGETMCILLTKEKPGAFGLPAGANVSPELTRIINRGLQGESQKTYLTFEDLHKDLEAVLHPPAVPRKVEEAAAAPGGHSALPGEWQEKLITVLERILSQRREMLYAEAAGLLVLLLVAWRLLHPYAGVMDRPPGPAGFVACSDGTLVAVSATNAQVYDRKSLGITPGDILADPAGRWLFVSDATHSRILRIQTKNDTPAEKFPFIPVDRDPGHLTMDARGASLYVVHEATNNVSRINLLHDPPQMQSIMAVGTGPRCAALSPDGATLYVTNYKAETVSVLDPETNQTLATVPCPGGPGALAVSPDGGQLWVACENRDVVTIIDTQTRAVTDVLTETQGTMPVSVIFSDDGTKVYVANHRSNNVSAFDFSRKAVVNTITTPAGPLELIRASEPNKLWLIASGSTAITAIDTQFDHLVPSGIDFNGHAVAVTIAR